METGKQSGRGEQSNSRGCNTTPAGLYINRNRHTPQAGGGEQSNSRGCNTTPAGLYINRNRHTPQAGGGTRNPPPLSVAGGRREAQICDKRFR